MGFHKMISPLGYGFAKSKTKQIDDINIIILSIGLNDLTKNLYMNINICSRGVDGVWRTPKLLVRPKMRLNWLNNEIVKSSGHAPSSQH